MESKPKDIILGLDVSTTTIGCVILLDDGSDCGKILELTHVAPKIPKNVKGVESLFIKKQIFNDEFLTKWKDFGITKVVIEEPLLSSNNVDTVATLLRFNGMISDCIYNALGIVPEYISSYAARKYSFPELMSVRKYDKDGTKYGIDKILQNIDDGHLVLFGAYNWDVDKKEIIQGKVSSIFPDINWLYDSHGELKKENFDACDAYVATLGYLKHQRHGDLIFKTSNIEVQDKRVKFEVDYWGIHETRMVYLT